ncbi:MAG: hypothetical protein R3B13_41575, partial [Polyangiaceae bacterium]
TSAGSGGAGSGGQAAAGASDAGGRCAPPPSGACTFLPHAGCATDETCVPFEPPQCCIAGDGAENAPCAGDNSCKVGLVCVGGTCRRFWKTSTDCPTATQHCYGFGSSAAAAICSTLTQCDLLAPWKVCPQGVGCVPVGNSGGNTIVDCVEAGDGIGPGTCINSPLEWAPGYVCNQGKCQQWCRLGASDCPQPLQCTQIPLPVSIAGATYGGCG